MVWSSPGPKGTCGRSTGHEDSLGTKDGHATQAGPLCKGLVGLPRRVDFTLSVAGVSEGLPTGQMC